MVPQYAIFFLLITYSNYGQLQEKINPMSTDKDPCSTHTCYTPPESLDMRLIIQIIHLKCI